jgi:hypothetical protein
VTPLRLTRKARKALGLGLDVDTYLMVVPVKYVFAARSLESGETAIILTGPRQKCDEKVIAHDTTEV